MSLIQQFKTAVLNASASGDNIAVAAVAGQNIKVWKVWLTAAGAVNAVFKDGASTALSGNLILPAAGSGFTLFYDGSPHWITSPGNAFIINLSGAVAISGEIYYTVNG